MSRSFSLRDYLRTATALPSVLRAEQSAANGVDDQTPLRAELFSADQMELHGSALAQQWACMRARMDPTSGGRGARHRAGDERLQDLLRPS